VTATEVGAKHNGSSKQRLLYHVSDTLIYHVFGAL